MITNISNIINQGLPQKDILLIGVEEYNIQSDLDKVLNKFYSNSDEDYNFHKIDATEHSLGALLDIANSFPMLGEKTTIVCKNFNQYFEGRLKKGDKNILNLENYFKNPNPTTRLILCVAQEKFSKVKNNKFPKPWDQIVESCDSVFYPKVWPNNFPKWINTKLNENGIKTNEEVIRVILSQTPENLRDIGNQVEKIVTYLGDKKSLDEKEIFNIIGNSRIFNVFELQKQVISRNLESALHILKNIYTNSKSDIIAISSIFNNFFKNVLKLIDNRNNSSNKYDLARQIGVSPFFVDDLRLAASNYNDKEIEKIFILLSETDLKLKSSNENQLNLVSKLLIDIMSK